MRWESMAAWNAARAPGAFADGRREDIGPDEKFSMGAGSLRRRRRAGAGSGGDQGADDAAGIPAAAAERRIPGIFGADYRNGDREQKSGHLSGHAASRRDRAGATGA